ncbi:MAG: ATP-binding cassette domain-containing protein [Planctomycetes bacterium]|nr:ATP-binding cassette domain-containing protein [Planctomycetota bacterium]
MTASSTAGSAMALSFDRASVDYGGGVGVRDVTAEIRPGEVVALIGPSGAGKSSLLRMIHGGLAPTSGRVVVDGREPSQLEDAELRRLRTGIGVVRQDLGLVPNLSVARNVIAGSLGRRSRFAAWRSMVLPRMPELEAVHARLERLGIGDKLFQRVDQLSGGEQQRVAIARAMYQGPRLMLADEPLSALDPTRSREVLELFVELAGESGATLVLSLHDVELARACVPRLIGLRDGRVHFDDASERLGDDELRSLYRIAGAPG